MNSLTDESTHFIIPRKNLEFLLSYILVIDNFQKTSKYMYGTIQKAAQDIREHQQVLQLLRTLSSKDILESRLCSPIPLNSVLISKEDLNKLLDSENFLETLEDYGIDNWQGYIDAFASHEDTKEQNKEEKLKELKQEHLFIKPKES